MTDQDALRIIREAAMDWRKLSAEFAKQTTASPPGASASGDSLNVEMQKRLRDNYGVQKRVQQDTTDDDSQDSEDEFDGFENEAQQRAFERIAKRQDNTEAKQNDRHKVDHEHQSDDDEKCSSSASRPQSASVTASRQQFASQRFPSSALSPVRPSTNAKPQQHSASQQQPQLYTWQWLIQQLSVFCDYSQTVEMHNTLQDDYNALQLNEQQLAQSLLGMLRQVQTTDEQLQSQLCDLLGFTTEAFECVERVIRGRKPLSALREKEELRKEQLQHALETKARAQFDKLQSAQRSTAPIQLKGFTVRTEDEVKIARELKKQDRRMARQTATIASLNGAALPSQKLNEVLLEDQANLLTEWRMDASEASKKQIMSQLPAGSQRKEFKSYIEVHVPPHVPKPLDEQNLIPIMRLDEFARPAFGKTTHLNRVQSACFAAAYHTLQNLLVAAPTGRLVASR